VKFYQKAVEALTEAKDICFAESAKPVHPLMTAVTLLNLSAVLGDIDHDEHGLRWGLEALQMMYDLFAQNVLPESVQAYYLALACHNAALLNVKLGKWQDAVELVNEGIEFTKVLKLLDMHDDGLRQKLIAIGAQAKRVPENFLAEAVNALNGWGEERGVWNLSFWDFTVPEIVEEIHVLQHTSTLKHMIIEHVEAVNLAGKWRYGQAGIFEIRIDPDARGDVAPVKYESFPQLVFVMDSPEAEKVEATISRINEKGYEWLVADLPSGAVRLQQHNGQIKWYLCEAGASEWKEQVVATKVGHQGQRRHGEVIDEHLARLIIAMVSCQSLEQVSISGIDFDPHQVWRRIKKKSFLETSWYASALHFSNVESSRKPTIAMYKDLLKPLNSFSKKLVLFLVVLGNECQGVDLSENCIDCSSITALVKALRWPFRPTTSHQVRSLILRDNWLDVDAVATLAKTWLPWDEAEQAAAEPPKQQAAPLALANDENTFENFFGLEEAPPAETQRRDSQGKLSTSGPTEVNVTSLDISLNAAIGDKGFQKLTEGISHFVDFRVLKADAIGLSLDGCSPIYSLACTRIELLSLSSNDIRSAGAIVVCEAALQCQWLHTLELNDCGIDKEAAPALSKLLEEHPGIKNILLNHNKLGSEGMIEFCKGASTSSCLTIVHLAYNDIKTEEAAQAIGNMMSCCDALIEMNLSGNIIDPVGAPHIGSAIEHSRILTMHLEDMGFNETSIDDFLDHGAAETQDLQVMRLNGNPVGDEGLGIIAECLSIGLTDLSLARCGLTCASQATLLNLVSLSPNLRFLDLSSNKLGPTGCIDMVTWMTQNDKENFSLRSLELADCSLGDDGLLGLLPLLGTLSHLGVSANNISSAGLEAVMNSKQMIQLRSLDLANNRIGEPGIHALTERFQQEHKRSLWNPKQLTSTIDKVVLSNNLISDSLAKSTEAFLNVHNRLLTVVW